MIVRKLDDLLCDFQCQQDLILIVQDWHSGIHVEHSCDGDCVISKLQSAKEKYGDKFEFRAFNDKIDVYWNGDFGVICEDQDSGNPCKILLEFDTKRHPGMKSFENILSKDQRSTISATEIKSANGSRFICFTKPQRKGERHAG